MMCRYILNYVIFLCIGLNNVFAGELILYPVQNNQIIIEKNCELSAKLEWNNELSIATGGMKRGDKLLALTSNSSKQVVARDLSCFEGECRENYMSIMLPDSGDIILAVVKKAENIKVSKILVEPVALGECAEIYASITYGSSPELHEQRKCQRVTLPNDAKLVVGTKTFSHEDDYLFRVASAQAKHLLNAPILEIDQGSELLKPILAIEDEQNNISLLWRKEAGICCPSEITLVMSNIDSKGSISLGRRFKAGGQPCGN